jgi:hypothetical protein
MGEAKRKGMFMQEENVVEITIRLTKDGLVSVKAPENKIMVLGLLEAAKGVVISSAVKRESPIVVPSMESLRGQIKAN